MKTNFFEQLAGLQFNGNLMLNIHHDTNGLLTVSAVLRKGNINATAGNEISPMLFTGTAEELDAGFFAAIATPLQITSGLITNLEKYQKEVEKAGKLAKEKNKSNKPAPVTDDDNDDEESGGDLFTASQPDDKGAKAEKKRLYDEQMEKVKKLAQDMKYAEALAQLPDAEEHPDKAEAIVAKRKEIEKSKGIYDQLQNQFND